MAADKYQIPARTQRTELSIKRSRFITSVAAAQDKSAALNFIDSVRTEFPDANHHCWAYIAGAPDDIYAVDKSDDGEPRGTAGKPMLNVLQHSGHGQIVVVVTRYFGGVKLGAGGLVRAYSQSVSAALSALDMVEYQETRRVQLSLPYDTLDRLEHWLKDADISIEQREFGAVVGLVLQVPPAQLAATQTALEEFGHGQIDWELLDPADPDLP